jgi:hypothetical protein
MVCQTDVKSAQRALVICLLLMKMWRLGKSYRDLVSFLADSTYLWPIINRPQGAS